MIEAKNLTKDYGDKRAVSDLSFTVRSGTVTGFLGPNGSGKSTTMRLILGLDAPSSGDVTVNGKHYRDQAAPLYEVGALLEARSVHTGRSAYNHLLALAQTHGIPRSRVLDLIDLVGLHDVARKRAGNFSLGMGQRLGIASALIGDPDTLILDEPVNGLDPEGIHWIRTLLRALAAEGRTVFVSSHLMSEMALTADHLIVIGRGQLIADVAVDEFVRMASGNLVHVRSPEAEKLRAMVLGTDVSVKSLTPGLLEVNGLSAEAIGEIAAGSGIVLHELTPQQASLEEAFMELTREDVEFRGAAPGELAASSTTVELLPRLPHTGKVTQARVIVSEWTKLRSLRSTQWSFLAAMILTIGFPALFAVVTSSHWGSMSPHDRAARTPIDFAVGGINLSQLAIGVLGVLVISGEYSTGMIRASLAAVPKRLPVLWAKIVVFAGASLVVILPSVVAAFFITQAILSRHDILQTSFTAPGIARCVIGGALFVTVLGVFALVLGAITRNTAAGIATFVGIMFVIPPIFELLPSSWNNAISPWLPSNAGRDIFQLTTGAHALHPWPGFLLFCGYTAVTVAVAAVLLRRRDA